MRMMARYVVFALFAVNLFSGIGLAQGETIIFRPNPTAPLNPNGNEVQYNSFREVQDERDPRRQEQLATQALPNAGEYRHLILRLRFQARIAQADDLEQIIESAEEGLRAEEYFSNGKLQFIEDPNTLPQWPAFQLDMANQRLVYYQALTTAHNELGETDEALTSAQQALDASDVVWDLFADQNDPASPEYEEAQARTAAGKESLLRTMLDIHDKAGNESDTLAIARRILDEVNPGDLSLLMNVVQRMSQNLPEDPDAAGAQLETAADYATRAISELEVWVDSPDAALVNERVKRDYLVEAHTNLGMIHFQTGDFAAAAEAFNGAVGVVPDDPTLHYRAGVAYYNSQQVDEAASALAKAVFLNFSDARPALEAAYQAKTGSLDGLDDFIQAEGSQLGLP